MPVKLVKRMGIGVIRLFGDLDMEDIVVLRNLISRLLAENCGQIVLDFERVQHINATGLGILAERQMQVRKRQGDLRVAGLNSYLQNIFELTGIQRVFRAYSSVEEAVRSFEALVAA